MIVSSCLILVLVIAPLAAEAQELDFKPLPEIKPWAELEINYVVHEEPVVIQRAQLGCDYEGELYAAFSVTNELCDADMPQGRTALEFGYPQLFSSLSTAHQELIRDCECVRFAHYGSSRPMPASRVSTFHEEFRRRAPIDWGFYNAISVLAPDEEGARKLANEVLDVAQRKRREHYVSQYRKVSELNEQLRDSSESGLQKLKRELDEVEAAYEKLAEKYSKDIRSNAADIIKQNILMLPSVEVELAGLQAKLQQVKIAIANTPKGRADTSKLLQQLQDMQTPLDIELAGQLARKNAIETQIEELRACIKTDQDRRVLASQIEHRPAYLANLAKKVQEELAELDKQDSCMQPLKLHENTVHIFKIRVID
ncbi:MAG: hypothetical protein AB7N71_00740 [Phycisphaerae bacterium]